MKSVKIIIAAIAIVATLAAAKFAYDTVTAAVEDSFDAITAALFI